MNSSNNHSSLQSDYYTLLPQIPTQCLKIQQKQQVESSRRHEQKGFHYPQIFPFMITFVKTKLENNFNQFLNILKNNVQFVAQLK